MQWGVTFMRLVQHSFWPHVSFAKKDEVFNVVTMQYDERGWQLPPPEKAKVSVEKLLGKSTGELATELALQMQRLQKNTDQTQSAIDNALNSLQQAVVSSEKVIGASMRGLAPVAMAMAMPGMRQVPRTPPGATNGWMPCRVLGDFL